MMKIAFSGSSGSGKTTLVNYVVDQLGLAHLSGSAGDVKTEEDKKILQEDPYDYPGGGHVGVIRYSALNPEYGWENQQRLLQRRAQLINGTHPTHGNVENFVTDRSPADNVVYCINQVGFHPLVTDKMLEQHIRDAVEAMGNLTHLIYVKAVQPQEVERNGSRVANRYYQKSVDALFEYWIKQMLGMCIDPPSFMLIDYWDLDTRKENVLRFLKS